MQGIHVNERLSKTKGPLVSGPFLQISLHQLDVGDVLIDEVKLSKPAFLELVRNAEIVLVFVDGLQ